MPGNYIIDNPRPIKVNAVPFADKVKDLKDRFGGELDGIWITEIAHLSKMRRALILEEGREKGVISGNLRYTITVRLTTDTKNEHVLYIMVSDVGETIYATSYKPKLRGDFKSFVITEDFKGFKWK
jgi:hypothetical protein